MSSPAEVVEINTDPAAALAARLRAEHGARITGELVVPAKGGEYVPLPAGLDARLVAALAGRGIDRLYTHQSSAWESVQAGRHSVVVTPTASGKTFDEVRGFSPKQVAMKVLGLLSNRAGTDANPHNVEHAPAKAENGQA